MILPDIKGENREEIILATKIRNKFLEILKTDDSEDEKNLFSFLMSQVTDAKFYIKRKFILTIDKEDLTSQEHIDLLKELVAAAENRMCVFCNCKIDGKGFLYKLKHEGKEIDTYFHEKCFKEVNNIVDDYCEKYNIQEMPELKGSSQDEIDAANKIRDNFINIIQGESKVDQFYLKDLVYRTTEAQWYMVRRCILNINHNKENDKRRVRFIEKLQNLMFNGQFYLNRREYPRF